MNADDYNQKQLDSGDLSISNVTTLTGFWQLHHPPLVVDGKAGPATIETLNDAEQPAPIPPEDMDWGQHALAVAVSILGWGETLGNNKGPQITVIRGGRILKPWQSGAWCADTTSYEALNGYAHFYGFDDWDACPDDLKAACPVKRNPSASGFMAGVAKAGSKVSVPRPGDFVLFKHPNNHHTAIVSHVAGNRFKTIDGNRGRWNPVTQEGSVVDYYNHEFGQPNIKYFARLPELPQLEA